MPYLIDGHNLIGQLPGIDLQDPDDEVRLVERLRSAMGRMRTRCTVVFDAGLPGGPSRELSTPSVQVVFAHGGTTADRIIMERIRAARDPNRWIIVTNDQVIVTAARRRGMRVIASGAFVREMNAPPPITDDENPNPHIGPAELDEWLALFGGEPDDNST